MWTRSRIVGAGWVAAVGIVAAACGGGDAETTATTAAGATTVPVTTVVTAPTDAPATTASAPVTAAPVPTAAPPPAAAATAAPAPTAAPVAAPTGGLEALVGLWFFECEEYLPGDGATSGVLDIQVTGPAQITVDVQGYRYLSADCSDEPAEDAGNLLVFDVGGVIEGPDGTEFAVTEASSGFSDSLSLGGDGVLTVDGDRLTRSVDFNTAYD